MRRGRADFIRAQRQCLHQEAEYMTASGLTRVFPFESPLTARAGPYKSQCLPGGAQSRFTQCPFFLDHYNRPLRGSGAPPRAESRRRAVMSRPRHQEHPDRHCHTGAVRAAYRIGGIFSHTRAPGQRTRPPSRPSAADPGPGSCGGMRHSHRTPSQGGRCASAPLCARCGVCGGGPAVPSAPRIGARSAARARAAVAPVPSQARAVLPRWRCHRQT
jgi:hypothetical protein